LFCSVCPGLPCALCGTNGVTLHRPSIPHLPLPPSALLFTFLHPAKLLIVMVILVVPNINNSSFHIHHWFVCWMFAMFARYTLSKGQLHSSSLFSQHSSHRHIVCTKELLTFLEFLELRPVLVCCSVGVFDRILHQWYRRRRPASDSRVQGDCFVCVPMRTHTRRHVPNFFVT